MLDRARLSALIRSPSVSKTTEASRWLAAVASGVTRWAAPSTGYGCMVETPLGRVETKSYSRNYRDFNGFLTATEIYLESSVQRQRITIEKVSFEEVPASEYAPPPGAK